MRQSFIPLIILFFSSSLSQEGNTMENITLAQAQEIAQRELDHIAPQYHFMLLAGQVEEYAFGWVFGFAPKKYIESRNPNDIIPGPSALAVERDGTIQPLPSRPPREAAIEEILRQWEVRHH
jgi:Immunity protein 35